MNIELECLSTSDDLKRWQNDFAHIDMWDEHIAGDLSDMLQEAEVLLFILQPGQFQVSVHVGTIGVSIPQIPVVVFTIWRHRHATVGTDAY